MKPLLKDLFKVNYFRTYNTIYRHAIIRKYLILEFKYWLWVGVCYLSSFKGFYWRFIFYLIIEVSLLLLYVFFELVWLWSLWLFDLLLLIFWLVEFTALLLTSASPLTDGLLYVFTFCIYFPRLELLLRLEISFWSS